MKTLQTQKMAPPGLVTVNNYTAFHLKYTLNKRFIYQPQNNKVSTGTGKATRRQRREFCSSLKDQIKRVLLLLFKYRTFIIQINSLNTKETK